MSGYRKLSRTAAQRKALLRNQVTMLLYHGKIVTTESKAKEVRKIAEGLIALAVKEKDNFETVTVKAKVARKDAEGKRVKEVVDGKKVTVFDEVEKEIQKDLPSRMNARRKMLRVFYPIKEVPAEGKGRKRNTKQVDMPKKMFEEIAPKYVNRNGGYTRIVKIGQRKGDAAMMVQPDEIIPPVAAGDGIHAAHAHTGRGCAANGLPFVVDRDLRCGKLIHVQIGGSLR